MERCGRTPGSRSLVNALHEAVEAGLQPGQIEVLLRLPPLQPFTRLHPSLEHLLLPLARPLPPLYYTITAAVTTMFICIAGAIYWSRHRYAINQPCILILFSHASSTTAATSTATDLL